MEYYSDLEKYYVSGPGSELNMKVACPLMTDLKKAFDKNELNRKKANFYFSHSKVILLLLNILGVKL